MAVRDLIFLSSQEKSQLLDKLQQQAQAWRDKWLAHSDAIVCSSLINVSGDFADELAALSWYTIEIDGNPSLWSANDAKKHQLLSNLLPGLVIAKEQAGEHFSLVNQAIQELYSEIFNCTVAIDDSEEPISTDALYFIGQSIWELTIDNLTLKILIPNAVLSQLIDRKAGQKSRFDANLPALVADKALSLEVRLPTFEAPVGAVRSLSVGDVLPINIPLDTPLNLVTENKEPIAQCYIGKALDKKAIVLSGKK